ncbi:hypothetical protein BGZ83_003612, partial [Gryganskiella cystojenkinii]
MRTSSPPTSASISTEAPGTRPSMNATNAAATTANDTEGIPRKQTFLQQALAAGQQAKNENK